MGGCCSKPVDEPVVKTPSKGEAQQETQQQETQQQETQQQETQQQETQQQETHPKGEVQGGTPSNAERARETAILVLDFAGIISEASDILKPMKAVSGFIKKILEVTKVSLTCQMRRPCSRNPKERAAGRRRLEGPH